MNNKKTKYVLLPLVLLLWGYIAYRIFEQVNPEIEIENSVRPRLNPMVESKAEDTYKLLLDYPDPFLKHIRIKKEKAEKEKQQTIVNRVYAWNWPNMNYGGCIQNKNKMVGLLQLNAKHLLVQEGKTYEKFIIEKLYADSIVIKRETEKRTIRKNQ